MKRLWIDTEATVNKIQYTHPKFSAVYSVRFYVGNQVEMKERKKKPGNEFS